MLNLVTGTPGAKKTAFVVSKLDKIEQNNKVNLVKNQKIYEKNLPIIDKFKDDFLYYEYEVGSGHDIQRKIDFLPDDYFNYFMQSDFDDLRPVDYFLRVVRFNEICERINDREGVQGFEGLLPVRTIYTNINNLKIDFVRSLVYDWRQCPDGSIVVIDEVQNVAPFDNLKDKIDPIIKDLTIHRHRGFDFYFITQFPILLHQTIRVLIGVHYHLTLPYGMTTKVYQFGSCRDRPDTFSNKHTAENKFNFNPPSRIFKLYKSTTINTHKARLPYKQLAIFGVFILCGVLLFFYGMRGTSKSSLVNHDKQSKPTIPLVATTDNPIIASTNNSSAGHTTLNAETITKTQAEQLQSQIDDLKSQYLSKYVIEMTKSEEVLPTSVVSMSGRCMAFNKYSERLLIDDVTCKKLLEVGGMPKSRNSDNNFQSSYMQTVNN